MTLLADDLFDKYRAFSDVDWKIFEKLVELFGEESIADTAHDSYDTSLEIYAEKDIEPTAEQAATIISWGFSRFWINFKDETEIHCYGTHIGQRRKRSYPKWGEKRAKSHTEGTQSKASPFALPLQAAHSGADDWLIHDAHGRQVAIVASEHHALYFCATANEYEDLCVLAVKAMPTEVARTPDIFKAALRDIVAPFDLLNPNLTPRPAKDVMLEVAEAIKKHSAIVALIAPEVGSGVEK